MNIAILDGVVLAVVLISALLAMFRGFVREVLSIAAWVAAAILAYLFYDDLTPYIGQYVDSRSVAVGLAAAAVFLVSLIVVSLITMKISDFVMDSPVGALDRLLGFIFGAARGLLLVVVAVIFFNWLVDAANRPQWVTTAVSYPQLSKWGEDLLNVIPDDPEGAIRGAFDDGAEPTGPAEPAGPAGPQPLEPNEQDQLDQLLDSTDPNRPTEPADGPGSLAEPDPLADPAEPDPLQPAPTAEPEPTQAN